MKKLIVLLVLVAFSFGGCAMPQQNQEQPELKIETYETAAYVEPENPTSHQLVVVDQHLYTMSSNFNLGIYQGQIKNIGTETASLGVEHLEILDQSGTVLFTINEFSTVAPTILKPGAIAYVTASQMMESLVAEDLAKISDYKLSYTSQPAEESPKDVSHLVTSELTLLQEEAALAGIVHNSSGEKLKDVNLVVIVRDADGNLLMAETVVIPNIAANGQADFKKEVMSPNPTSEYENVVLEGIFY